MNDGEDDEDALTPPAQYWPYDFHDKVVLGGKALCLGAFIAHGVFSVLLSIPSFISTGTASWVVAIFLFAAIPAWIIGLIVGAILDVCLRRVRNQWIHVAVFFAAGALICVPFGGFSSWGATLFSLSIALAAGVGRLSVWKLVKLNPQRSLTE